MYYILLVHAPILTLHDLLRNGCINCYPMTYYYIYSFHDMLNSNITTYHAIS